MGIGIGSKEEPDRGAEAGELTDASFPVRDDIVVNSAGYLYAVGNVGFENGTWVIRYPNLVNRFTTKPQWLTTLEEINGMLDQEAAAGRDPWLLRTRIDEMYEAACRDYRQFACGHFQPGQGNVACFVDSLRDRDGRLDRETQQLLIRVFAMKDRDNSASSGSCPMAIRHCSESFKFTLILEALRGASTT